MTEVVKAVHLCKSYGEHRAVLNDINITISEGEFVTIIGRSGSGKSTLLNILGCLDKPTSGEVFIRGSPVDYSSSSALIRLRQKALGFVFQQFNLLPHLTAKENIWYPLLFTSFPPAGRRERAAKLLELVGLEDRADHYPAQLSGGEQQRVAIARALVNNPPLVLADEPTGNLDSATGEDVLGLMRQINREQNTTFLIVTHEREYRSFSDRTIEIRDGRTC